MSSGATGLRSCQGLALPHFDPASVMRLALIDSTLLCDFESTLRFRAGNLGHYPVIGITSPASSPLNESKIVQHCEAIRPLDEGNSICAIARGSNTDHRTISPLPEVARCEVSCPAQPRNGVAG